MISVSCRHVLTPPRHPQSNGAAENFVRTLKNAIASLNPGTFDELDRGVDNFLMLYRNAVHSTTGHIPAKLFKSRVLRTNLHLKSAEVVYHRGNDLRPSRGIVLDNLGQRVYRTLDLDDGTVPRRHMNYIPVQMLKTVQKNPEDLSDYSTKPAVIAENRSFIQAAADVVPNQMLSKLKPSSGLASVLESVKDTVSGDKDVSSANGTRSDGKKLASDATLFNLYPIQTERCGHAMLLSRLYPILSGEILRRTEQMIQHLAAKGYSPYPWTEKDTGFNIHISVELWHYGAIIVQKSITPRVMGFRQARIRWNQAVL
ncbi:unnamed protein product [Echinostoma caproni]|uniref:Integrase catalytic domain-containing protein n=1 Tax=Echinostoma caproni TaxID=27848 RepID=A0A3P8GYK2_9TREM|nr:unnamed protein product [Echinostoma caproni]